MMKTISVNIKKPLYGNFVYINGNVITKAIEHGAWLEITIPKGRAIVDPRQWKETAIKIEKVMKKVFKFPDNPMILYGGSVPLPAIKGEVVKSLILEPSKQTKLF